MYSVEREAIKYIPNTIFFIVVLNSFKWLATKLVFDLYKKYLVCLVPGDNIPRQYNPGEMAHVS